MSNMNGKRKAHDNDVDVREPDSKIKKVDDVKQRRSVIVEVRPENERFSRLLDLLKEEEEWYDDDKKRSKILIFVKSDEECDALSSDLLKRGYSSLSLHDFDDAGESMISDFKNRSNILIATSVAARSLNDVKDVQLVVNFQLPICYVDYDYRSGHIGSKGCTVTFLSGGHDEIYAPLLTLDLAHSNQVVPDDLSTLVESYAVKHYPTSIFLIPGTIKDDLYVEEMEINDYPHEAALKVKHKDVVMPIIKSTGVAIAIHYIEPCGTLPRGSGKVYISIKGPTQQSVNTALTELKRVLEDASKTTTQPLSIPTSQQQKQPPPPPPQYLPLYPPFWIDEK